MRISQQQSYSPVFKKLKIYLKFLQNENGHLSKHIYSIIIIRQALMSTLFIPDTLYPLIVTIKQVLSQETEPLKGHLPSKQQNN